MRTCAYLHAHAIFRFSFFPITRLILRCYEYGYGIRIPYQTQIGSGFYISHAAGIVINPYTVIGRNCNISGQVTLGEAGSEAGKGQPVIGDNVHIGPRAKVIGVVRVGNKVVISADCVVSEDIPDASVVFGSPDRVVPLDESAVYIYRTDYAREFI
jgi:serine O-acetyltransferase